MNRKYLQKGRPNTWHTRKVTISWYFTDLNFGFGFFKDRSCYLYDAPCRLTKFYAIDLHPLLRHRFDTYLILEVSILLRCLQWQIHKAIRLSLLCEKVQVYCV